MFCLTQTENANLRVKIMTVLGSRNKAQSLLTTEVTFLAPYQFVSGKGN